MRRTVILISSLLVLTACAPTPSQAPPSASPPDVSPSVSATPEPSASADAFAELAASVADAEGVVAVEGSAYAADPTAGIATIVVDDDLERAPLQSLVESLVATSEQLGLDLDDSDVRVQTEASPSNRPLVWLGGGVPADLTAEFDAWQWLDELDGSERPTARLVTTDDRPDYQISTDVVDAVDDGLAAFIAGVAEGGEMADALTGSPIELIIAATPDSGLCSQVIVSGAPITETAAALLTTIVTDGFDGQDVCVPYTSTESSTQIGATRVAGGDLDDALAAQIVAAFEAAGVPIG